MFKDNVDSKKLLNQIRDEDRINESILSLPENDDSKLCEDPAKMASKTDSKNNPPGNYQFREG